MELLVVVLALVALAVLAPLFGADTRAGREWSVGALVRPRQASGIVRPPRDLTAPGSMTGDPASTAGVR